MRVVPIPGVMTPRWAGKALNFENRGLKFRFNYFAFPFAEIRTVIRKWSNTNANNKNLIPAKIKAAPA